MKETKGLSLQIVGAVAIAALCGTSAFAESSHHNRTDRSSSSSRNVQQRSDQQSRGSYRAPQQPARQVFQQNDRSVQNNYRSVQQNNYRSGTSVQRSFRAPEANFRSGVSSNWNRGGAVEARGRAIQTQGRITRMVHENGGYRVWLDRGSYPFFVPEARFNSFPLRVGLGIRFGGFYDPLGFVNVYDVGGYNSAYTTSQGELTGVVESVDYRNGTLVLNDDTSGRFVTVAIGGDSRMDDLRRGDQVQLSGTWSSNGLFRAYELEGVN